MSAKQRPAIVLPTPGLPTKSIEHGRGALISASSTRRGPPDQVAQLARRQTSDQAERESDRRLSVLSEAERCLRFLGKDLLGAHGSFLLNAGLVRPLGLEQFETFRMGTGA